MYNLGMNGNLSVRELWGGLSLLGAAGLPWCMGSYSPPSTPDLIRAKQAIGLGSWWHLSALTLKSRRTIEYLVPFSNAVVGDDVDDDRTASVSEPTLGRLATFIQTSGGRFALCLVVIVRFMGRISGHCAR